MTKGASDKLAKLRQEIDGIDEQLLKLINNRAKVVEKVGALKNTNLEKIKFRPEREAQIYRRLQKLNHGPLSHKAISQIFRELISSCMALEQKLKVTYLGPTGTHSETAVRHHFGHAVILKPMPTVADALREVEIGKADFAVIPVENSLEGAVGSTLDLLLTTTLNASGEVVLPIHHHLLSNGNTLAEIKQVAAHPQALGQCRNWLRINLPNVQLISVVSNAVAAEMASSDKTLAAIAGASAGEYYRLSKLAENIEDSVNNSTRFLIMGKIEVQPSGLDRTSLVFTTANVPGTLYSFLTPFSQAGISLCRIESRPAPKTLSQSHKNSWHKNWEYVFFIDFEGHQFDKKVASAIKKVSPQVPFLKIIGSYPQSPHTLE